MYFVAKKFGFGVMLNVIFLRLCKLTIVLSDHMFAIVANVLTFCEM